MKPLLRKSAICPDKGSYSICENTKWAKILGCINLGVNKEGQYYCKGVE